MTGTTPPPYRLAVGLAALGRPAYINVGRTDVLPVGRSVEAMRHASWTVLDAAYAAGLRWVDVARSYGRAEEFLAGWLDRRDHSDVTVSSKWGYAYVGNWRVDAPVHEVKEHSLARFEQQLRQSRALLGERIALYQVHSLTMDSPLFDQPALQARLAELAAGGVRVGFSTSGPGQADTVRRGLALEIDGQPVFTAVQSTWNPLEPSAGQALDEAHRAGALVMVKEVLANGTLLPHPPAPVAALANSHDTTPDAIALAAALAQPWADVVLAGPASVEQLTTNLDAINVRLNWADLDTLVPIAQLPQRYWANRAALRWV
jgi:aryl-alcohol dehydrogenase-like predicted oxidoreductase